MVELIWLSSDQIILCYIYIVLTPWVEVKDYWFSQSSFTLSTIVIISGNEDRGSFNEGW